MELIKQLFYFIVYRGADGTVPKDLERNHCRPYNQFAADIISPGKADCKFAETGNERQV